MLPNSDVWPLLRMNNWHRSWADLVEEWIFAHRPDLRLSSHQVAIGGSSIFELEARYETQVKVHAPDWILFTLGTNDCSRKIPLDDFRSRLTAYVARAQKDSGARFFYAGGMLAMPGLSAADAEHIGKSQAYCAIAREVVRASGGMTPEIGRIMKEKAELHFAASAFHSYYADGVHLGPLGNHVLAGIVLEELGVFAG